MEETKHGLGEAGLNIDLTAPMRSRISDTLVPPPLPEGRGDRPVAPTPKYDPNVIAEKIWTALMSHPFPPLSQGEGKGEGGFEFEARFYLKNGKGFTLMGDKERFGAVQPIEPFMEVHERLLEVYHKDVVKVDIFMDDRALTFSSYNDLLEWLEI